MSGFQGGGSTLGATVEIAEIEELADGSLIIGDGSGAPAEVTGAFTASTGTLKHEKGGLEADVSAYSGLVKISGGATSAVTVTAAGEAILDDANAAAQRTTLGAQEAISGATLSAATVATGDKVLIQDSDDSDNLKTVTAQAIADLGGGGSMPRGHIDGLIMSNGTDTAHDIDIAAGTARDANNDTDLTLTAGVTRQLDVAFGTGNGGLSSSLSPANNTTYHVFICKDSGGTVTVGFDTSLTAANLVTDHSITNPRIIGSLVTDGSANFRQFIQQGDLFLWQTPVTGTGSTNPGTSAVTRTLTVPTGLKLSAIVNVTLYATSGSSPYAYLSSLDAVDLVPDGSNGYAQISVDTTSAIRQVVQVSHLVTNTSGQIRSRVNQSVASTRLDIASAGWIHPRGKNA